MVNTKKDMENSTYDVCTIYDDTTTNLMKSTE